MHDLVIRIIAEYLRDEESNTNLVKLISLNQRFYLIRHMFIKQLSLNNIQSEYAYKHQPYGWNKVRCFLLYNCQDICDVSQLGLIHTVKLLFCHNITSISALYSVHTLSVIWCGKVSNISALKTVRNLMIDYCHKISDVSALGTVHNLVLMRCHNITDISPLKTVYALTIKDCNGLKNILMPNMKIFNDNHKLLKCFAIPSVICRP